MRLIEKLMRKMCKKNQLPAFCRYDYTKRLNQSVKLGEKSILSHDFSDIIERNRKQQEKFSKQYNTSDKYGK